MKFRINAVLTQYSALADKFLGKMFDYAQRVTDTVDLPQANETLSVLGLCKIKSKQVDSNTMYVLTQRVLPRSPYNCHVEIAISTAKILQIYTGEYNVEPSELKEIVSFITLTPNTIAYKQTIISPHKTLIGHIVRKLGERLCIKDLIYSDRKEPPNDFCSTLSHAGASNGDIMLSEGVPQYICGPSANDTHAAAIRMYQSNDVVYLAIDKSRPDVGDKPMLVDIKASTNFALFKPSDALCIRLLPLTQAKKYCRLVRDSRIKAFATSTVKKPQEQVLTFIEMLGL